MDLNYPASITSQNPRTKGIWCGRYFLYITDKGSNKTANLFLPIFIGYPTIANSDIDWFYEESFLQTSTSTTEISLSLRMQGFDGKLKIDSLTLEEVESVRA